METIQVGLGALNQRTENFTLAENATVSDLLTAAGKESQGYTFTVNGETASLNDHLDDGDVVVRLQAVKGGSN